jgi:adenylylsulfate kinase-like enzyme
MTAPFAVWMTGRPAAGKTTLARLVRDALRARGLGVLWLDSDDMRAVITPVPTFSDEERTRFYGALAHIARRAVEGGVPVVVSATTLRDAWLEPLRRTVSRFGVVHLECSPEEAERRDPKGLYAAAREGRLHGLPGFDVPFERTHRPDLTLDSTRMTPLALTDAVLRWLEGGGWLDDAPDA